MRWSIPLSRNDIFNDKFLKLPEKRNLMNLLKLIHKDVGNSDCVHSAAQCSIPRGAMDGDSGMGDVSDKSAVEFLNLHQISNSDLIFGLIHGVCLHPFTTDSLSASDFVRRLRTAVESLTVYESGCPLMVPLYGVSDIIQSFARSAAVHGATHILNCDYKRLEQELREQPEWIRLKRKPAGELFHAIVGVEENDQESVLLEIHSGSVPVYSLRLPSGQEGINLYHLVSIEKFEVLEILINRKIIFKILKNEHFYEESIFGISNSFRVAEDIFREIVQDAGIELHPEIHPEMEEDDDF